MPLFLLEGWAGGLVRHAVKRNSLAEALRKLFFFKTRRSLQTLSKNILLGAYAITPGLGTMGVINMFEIFV